jgi:pSer/pThr/pTyr-binding forkhead associated (FHA) protein
MARPTPSPHNAPLARVQLESAAAPLRRWHVIWRGNSIELPSEGVLVLGRSPRCDVVIDNTEVSRTHCRLEVTAAGVTVEDLRSSNGTYVNGERVRAAHVLVSGDRLLLGTEEVVVHTIGSSAAVEQRPHVLTPELPIDPASDGPAAWRRERPRSDQLVVTTQKADAFETLGRLADRMLATGRKDAAAKILSGHMKAVLGGVRAGNELPNEVVAGSTKYAMKLAAARQEGSWIDYVIDLHMALRRPLPAEVIEEVRSLVLRGVKMDRDLLSAYKQTLRASILEGAEMDRSLVESILALEPPVG